MTLKHLPIAIFLVSTLCACGGTDEEKERDAKRNATTGCESMTQQANGGCESKPEVVGNPKNTM